ncbi:MAG: type II toxin-antitoxin system RelE/ParE family toxin [Hyphomicrobiaceae bacterium]
MNVRYSRCALTQLEAVHEYLLDRNRSATGTVAASIRSTIARLGDMPSLGKATDEESVCVIVEPGYHYRVFYNILDREVFVLRILHGRQQ